MAFKDYNVAPASNTTLGDGTYIGANMLRNKVRPAFQQLAADGKALWNDMNALVLDPATANFVPSGTGAVGRTIGAVLRDRPSLKDFFAVPDANYNNAFTKAIAAVNTGQISGFHIPAGSYPHTTALPPITRNGAWITGDGERASLVKPQGSIDSLRCVSTSPLTARISDLCLKNFSIDYGDVSAPTAGVALTLDRVDRSYIKIDIRNAYQGLLIRGGGDAYIEACTIASAYTWSSLATGSWLAKFTNYPGSTEVPSEWMIGTINWKGADANLDRAIVIECGDGIFFSTGHAGFAYNSQLHINPQPDAALSILNIDMGKIYFDGNSTGSASGAVVEIAGSTLPTVIGIDLSGVTIRNFPGKGLRSNLTTLKDLKIRGSQFSDLGKEHIDLTGTTQYSITDNTFRTGNGGNGSSSAVKLTSCTAGAHTGNRIMQGAFTHPKGFELTSVIDGTFAGNITQGITTDYSIGVGCDRITFSGNLKVGQVPSVASADGFTLPMGFDVVKITGTANMSNIASPNIEGYTVALAFTGTASFNDGAGNVYLNGTGGFTATAGSTLTLRNDGTKWVEVSRAII